MAYTDDGPADGRLVVLVPGMGDLRSTWRELVEPLTGVGYRVATTDLRGHGDSDTTFRTHGDVATAGDVLALVDRLGGPAVLVGSSMGAAAVAYAAAERPDAVDGLVMTGPILRDASAGSAGRLVYPVLFARPWGAGVWSAHYRKTLNRGRQAPWLGEHVQAVRSALSDPEHLAQFRTLTRQLTHAPVTARLPQLHLPVLAFLGRLDPDYRDPQAEGAWIEQALCAQVELLDDVAHYPHHQAPDIVVPAVLGFLAGLPAPDQPTALSQER